MADTSAGFRYRGRKSGGDPTVQIFPISGTVALTKGDLVSLNGSAQLVLGVTSATKFLGAVMQSATGDGAAGVSASVIVDADAIYGVNDNNARNKAATLDIAGATGAQGVAASSNKEFVVFATKAKATDETLVCFNFGKHCDNTAL